MKIVRLAIFLTGIMGLAMGGVTAISSLKTNQEEALIKTHETLKSEATLLVDQFFGVIEASKSLARSQGAQPAPSYITHRAVLNLKEGNPSEFESFSSTDSESNPNPQIDFSLQDRVMNSMKTQLSMGDLNISRVAFGTYGLSDIGTKEGVFVATPVYKVVNGVTDPSTIEKVSLVLIDPVKAMSGLQKVSGREQSAYLISKTGKVLAHSFSAYVGTDLKRVSGLKETVENLFLGAQTGSVGKYKSVDGSKQVLAMVRAGTSPFAFAVEQKAKPAVLSGPWISEQLSSGAARKNMGVGLMMLAIALLAFSGISIYATKDIEKQIEQNARERRQNEKPLPMMASATTAKNTAPKVAPSLVASGVPPRMNGEGLPAQAMNQTVSDSLENFVELRAELKQGLEEQNEAKTALLNDQNKNNAVDLEDFVDRLRKCYTSEAIEQEFTSLTTLLTDSPILYFRYHKRNQSLSLTSVAGNVKIPNYSQMQAYVRKDIELQVEQLANEGKVASVTNYSPINKLMMGQLNVAHFEAWAVTSSPEISGQSRLVGVLVILQAGIKSAQARPVIAKVLKESGNYLYAASNKIKPRSAVYESAKNVASDTTSVDTIHF